MNKLAILVLGAEGTGTRVITEFLCANGFRGTYRHEQKHIDDKSIDEFIEEVNGFNRLVIRRSIPHNNTFISIKALYNYLTYAGYEVKTVITTREWMFMSRSQVKANHTESNRESIRNAQIAYKDILKHIGMDYIIVNYESLVNYPDIVQRGIFENLQIIPFGEITTIVIIDGNEKYINEM